MTSLWLATKPISTKGVAPVAGATYDTVLAGAGLTGVTTALLLARAGQRVALVEARLPGAVTTGNTMAKLSLLQGTVMSRTRRHQGDERLRRHAAAIRAGQAWLVEQMGHVPMTRDRVLVATGYDKWGMTNAVAAALRLAGALTGTDVPWAKPLDALPPRAMSSTGCGSAQGWRRTSPAGWAAATTRPMPDDAPPEGMGVVGRVGTRPAGMSTVVGRTCTVSAVCTHLGGVLRWNDAERSWDCPLHRSRFSPTGRVLEGPAVDDLPELPDRRRD